MSLGMVAFFNGLVVENNGERQKETVEVKSYEAAAEQKERQLASTASTDV